MAKDNKERVTWAYGFREKVHNDRGGMTEGSCSRKLGRSCINHTKETERANEVERVCPLSRIHILKVP